MQETYVRAFTGLDMFRGDAAFGTWITRIAMNEALGRLRAPAADGGLGDATAKTASRPRSSTFPSRRPASDPEKTMAQSEIRAVLEQAIDALPDAFRAVFVARIVEGMSVEETADLFGLQAGDGEDAAASRAHCCCARTSTSSSAPRSPAAFPFGGRRCERMTETMVRRLCTG